MWLKFFTNIFVTGDNYLCYLYTVWQNNRDVTGMTVFIVSLIWSSNLSCFTANYKKRGVSDVEQKICVIAVMQNLKSRFSGCLVCGLKLCRPLCCDMDNWLWVSIDCCHLVKASFVSLSNTAMSASHALVLVVADHSTFCVCILIQTIKNSTQEFLQMDSPYFLFEN